MEFCHLLYCKQLATVCSTVLKADVNIHLPTPPYTESQVRKGKMCRGNSLAANIKSHNVSSDSTMIAFQTF